VEYSWVFFFKLTEGLTAGRYSKRTNYIINQNKAQNSPHSGFKMPKMVFN